MCHRKLLYPISEIFSGVLSFHFVVCCHRKNLLVELNNSSWMAFLRQYWFCLQLKFWFLLNFCKICTEGGRVAHSEWTMTSLHLLFLANIILKNSLLENKNNCGIGAIKKNLNIKVYNESYNAKKNWINLFCYYILYMYICKRFALI